MTTALLASITLRATAGWIPQACFAANAMGAAVGGLYCPMLMSTVYDRAKRSSSAYQFHLTIEAGWDLGAMLGCFTSAAVVMTGAQSSLAVLPAVLGVLVLRRCVRTDPPPALPRAGFVTAPASAA